MSVQDTDVQRKIVATGGSLAVTLPAEVVQELGLQKGDEVDVTIHPLTKVVTIRPGVKHYEGGQVTSRVKADIDRLLRENAVAYAKLAK